MAQNHKKRAEKAKVLDRIRGPRLNSAWSRRRVRLGASWQGANVSRGVNHWRSPFGSFQKLRVHVWGAPILGIIVNWALH